MMKEISGRRPHSPLNSAEKPLDEIDDQQLDEYKYLLNKLGEFPDKIQINVLTMIADDFSAQYPHSSSVIYNCIRELLVSIDVPPAHKLPLVYVIDSILKNVKGNYISIIRGDIPIWMPIVHESLSASPQYDMAKQKLRKVWNTWREFNIFSEKDWKQMGAAFIQVEELSKSSKVIADARARAIGIARSTDGTLILPPVLRKHMQEILDDVQRAENVDELNKVSLERLADINQELFLEIKKAAEDIAFNEISSHKENHTGSLANNAGNAIFAEIRPPHIVERSAEWKKANLNYLEKSSEIITKLNGYVKMGTNPIAFKDENDSKWLRQYSHINMNDLLGSCSACATILTSMLDRIRIEESSSSPSQIQSTMTDGLRKYMSPPNVSLVTKNFTAEAIKEKNTLVIERLYNAGLPFVCSTDGRRFATQTELAAHLDKLFKKRTLEKSMERSEERGWYLSTNVWSGVQNSESVSLDSVTRLADGNSIARMNTHDLTSIDSTATGTVTADELRDRCVLCGLNFTMYFDQDEGEWKYKNCNEIEVLRSDAIGRSGSDLMLVHVTCLRGLGSPHVLYSDQIVPTAATR